MKTRLLILAGSLLILVSCKPGNKNETAAGSKDLITKKDLKLSSPLLTPEVLWSFGRISEVEVSPDGKMLLFGISYYDIPLDKGNRELYTMDTEGKDMKRLTFSAGSESNAVWCPDGKKIGFLSSESGTSQIWEMNPDGSARKRITDLKDDITGFKFSPDGKKLLFTQEVKLDSTVKDVYPDLPKSTARIMTDLMYRHWDQWVDTYSHLFVADYANGEVRNPVDLLMNEPYETPNKPFGGMEQIVWSPDSRFIAYSCRKLKGKAYSLSTNTDLYIYDLASKSTVNISKGMMGYDLSPVYSPDGKKIAWESMERDGYESDKVRLMVYDFATAKTTDFSKDFDQDSKNLVWSADGQYIYFISDFHATDELYKLDLGVTKINKLTSGVHDYTSVALAGSKLIGTRQSMSAPTEIYSVDPVSGQEQQISFVNKDLLDQLKFGRVQSRWIKTTDNRQMLTWVIYPPDFDSTKKYPALLYCEGGPQSTVSQFWSYRWNFQIMAANGYIIVAPNRRGLPGFGQEWLEQISGDYGGQNMKDYLSAIDEVSKEPYVNKDKLGCVGASYGGFSAYWLAGNHNKRFKAFIAHDGMFNLESQYLETEEMWFVNWDLGGPFWDKNNKTAQKSYANSPHRFVQNWDTPILIIHGDKDYRICFTQGMSAFNAAILRGVPAKFLYFPDENHWVLHPQDGVLWQREFFKWLDKWLK